MRMEWYGWTWQCATRQLIESRVRVRGVAGCCWAFEVRHDGKKKEEMRRASLRRRAWDEYARHKHCNSQWWEGCSGQVLGFLVVRP